MVYKLTGDYIVLIKLLKLLHICNSGGEAKKIVESGLVKINGIIEYRKRAKIVKTNFVTIHQLEVEIEIQ